MYHALKNEVLRCELGPGSQVLEGEIAQRYGVSRTPVREALKRLMQDGLVEVLPRGGCAVTPVTVRDLQEVFFLRVILEGEAAALATPRVSQELLEELETLLAETLKMEVSSGADEARQAYLRANHTFHVSVAEASGNTRLAKMVIHLLDQAARFIYLQTSVVGMLGAEESVQIVAAMRARDADSARRFMREHVQATHERAMKVILLGAPTEILVLSTSPEHVPKSSK
jgi:DNA-binding GntR family transcriptional regulator